MRDKILSLLEKKGDIPPLPDILTRLSAKIDEPDCELSEIASLIETEPVLSGKMLTLANSVFFGGGLSETKNLTTAVMRLGLKITLDLAYTLKLPKMFNGVRVLNQRQFWRHSLAVGILSKAIGKLTLDDADEQERSYVSGLMHDVGIMVFCYLVPGEYAGFLKTAGSETKPLEQLESERFGIAHPELGARFIQKWWKVHPEVVQSVKNHHVPASNRSKSKTCSHVVYVANRIANHNAIGNGTQVLIGPSKEDIVSGSGISQDDFNALIEEMRENLEFTESVLNG